MIIGSVGSYLTHPRNRNKFNAVFFNNEETLVITTENINLPVMGVKVFVFHYRLHNTGCLIGTSTIFTKTHQDLVCRSNWAPKWKVLPSWKDFVNTRMHSSRMRTGRSLTVCRGGGFSLAPGGSPCRGSLPAPGGLPALGSPCRGVFSLPGGVSPYRGVSIPGGGSPCRRPPPREQNHTQL